MFNAIKLCDVMLIITSKNDLIKEYMTKYSWTESNNNHGSQVENQNDLELDFKVFFLC